MATQIVMDHTGDSRHQFDAQDKAALLIAEERFRSLTLVGFTAALRTSSCFCFERCLAEARPRISALRERSRQRVAENDRDARNSTILGTYRRDEQRPYESPFLLPRLRQGLCRHFGWAV